MTPERYQRLRQTLDRRQPDLTLLTEQIHKPRNIAALVRTSDAVGIHRVHMVWPWERHKAFSGTAMGSDRWVEVQHHRSMPGAIQQLQGQGYKVYAAHLSHESLDYRDVDYTRPCAILLGNEKQGVTAEAVSHADHSIVIPMMGMVESYNVSVAAAIILAEAQRQRNIAGMYQQVRLDQQEYWRTFFRWAHPRIARYCERNGLEYPPVNHHDGEIIDASSWYHATRKSADSASPENSGSHEIY